MYQNSSGPEIGPRTVSTFMAATTLENSKALQRCVPGRKGCVSCKVEEISSGDNDRGSSGMKSAVRSPANSGFVIRGINLHDGYHVDGHLSHNCPGCCVTHGYYEAITPTTPA